MFRVRPWLLLNFPSRGKGDTTRRSIDIAKALCSAPKSAAPPCLNVISRTGRSGTRFSPVACDGGPGEMSSSKRSLVDLLPRQILQWVARLVRFVPHATQALLSSWRN